MNGKNFYQFGLVILASIGIFGCAQSNLTNPRRSATEQLLLSTAVDRAIERTNYILFSGKKVFLDGTYFNSYDSEYVLGSVRDALSRAGALLVSDATNSDIILEARSGALSIDASQSLIGLPHTGVGAPMAASVELPEIALYKADRQYSYARLSLLAYDANSREHVFSSGPILGQAYNKYYKLLGLIQWTLTDVPEKKRKKSKPPTASTE